MLIISEAGPQPKKERRWQAWLWAESGDGQVPRREAPRGPSLNLQTFWIKTYPAHPLVSVLCGTPAEQQGLLCPHRFDLIAKTLEGHIWDTNCSCLVGPRVVGGGGVCRGTYLWNHSSVQVCRNLVCLSAVSSHTAWCGFVNLIFICWARASRCTAAAAAIARGRKPWKTAWRKRTRPQKERASNGHGAEMLRRTLNSSEGNCIKRWLLR